ncbi:choice-of-anchor A family protein [Streptomyces sp. NBC_00691]|uniref:choice-of-anchor A family protein n=1 Tax=Streptomyces sp. NBC_00691 TaxID=2903671 RepID=UPI002E36813E|nr:choice-of-anchor A family protein [Streptomyces sp. NBC_00691]
MSTTGRTGLRLSSAVALGVVLGVTAAGPALAAPLAPAPGSTRTCPAPGEEPGIGNEPRFTDANVALFAGGDYTVDGASAEAEGLLVVAGNARFAKTSGGVFNVGRAGAGSGIVPPAGSVMLAVGGNLAIAGGTTVDVGHGLTSSSGYGSAVRVGGAVDEKGRLETNGGSRSEGLGARAALTPYDTFAGTVRAESASLGALKPTGTSVRRGDTVTFEGGTAGGTGPQVFQISAKELDGASSFDFRSIPERASVVVNVTGRQAVGISPLSVGFNGDRVDAYSSAHFGEAASRILYNFEAAPSLTLGGGGNFMGSILAPEASADLTASTNGRVYVGGDLRTHGTGNETHNYPWTGSSTFTCKPTPGGPSATPTPTPSTTTPTTTSPTPTTSQPGEETPGTPETTAPEGSAPPTESSSAPAAPGTTAPSPSATVPGDGSLATTGAQLTPYAVGAAALGAAGAAILVVARRRRAGAQH